MIYINFVELHCLMLHAKFQNHKPSGSGEEEKVLAIYSHGGHLDLFKNAPLIGPVVSEEKTFEHCVRRQLRRTTEHGYTISSPCEPNGSGELKLMRICSTNIQLYYVGHQVADLCPELQRHV